MNPEIFSQHPVFGNVIIGVIFKVEICTHIPPETQDESESLDSKYEGTARMANTSDMVPIIGKIYRKSSEEWIHTHNVIGGVIYPIVEDIVAQNEDDEDEDEDDDDYFPLNPVPLRPQCTREILLIDKGLNLSNENSYNADQIVGIFTGTPGIYTRNDRVYGFRYATGQIKLDGEYKITHSVLNGQIVDYDPML